MVDASISVQAALLLQQLQVRHICHKALDRIPFRMARRNDQDFHSKDTFEAPPSAEKPGVRGLRLAVKAVAPRGVHLDPDHAQA